jgi:hypothetical protein
VSAASTNWERRRAAFAEGRAIRADLLQQFCQRYHLAEAPSPALVVDELLTDFLDVTLHYDPLPLERFAQTQVRNGRIIVTVNSQTYLIPGVKDVEEVQNVGKWHEVIHVKRHLDLLRTTDQPRLPGLDIAQEIVCTRATTGQATPEAVSREFLAEEAGRAAAVSLEALSKSPFYQEFQRRARRNPTFIPEAWELLYQAAIDIGVNRTALITQLTYEGRITVGGERGRKHLRVPLNFLHALGGAE